MAARCVRASRSVLLLLALGCWAVAAELPTESDWDPVVAGEAFDEKGDVLGRRLRTSASNSQGKQQRSSPFGFALFGFFAFILSFPVLWGNELREVKMWSLFGRAEEIAKEDVSSCGIKSSNDRCLVHVTGTTHVEAATQDPDLDIAVKCARIHRMVEMFQWAEEKKGEGDSTVYRYKLEWRQDWMDSGRFREEQSHKNPLMPFKTDFFEASSVLFGDFTLPKGLIKKMCNWKGLDDKECPSTLQAEGRAFQRQGSGSGVYTTVQGGTPALGDLRITLKKVPCGDVTVLAVQDGNSFAPMLCDARIEDGKVLLDSQRLSQEDSSLLSDGSQTETEQVDKELLSSGSLICKFCELVNKAVGVNMRIFEIAEEHKALAEVFENAKTTQEGIYKVLHILGFLMMVGGLFACLMLVPSVLSYIPFVGGVLGFLGCLLACGASCFCGSILYCVTVALAWVRARPLKGLALLSLAGILLAVPFALQHMEAGAAVATTQITTSFAPLNGGSSDFN